MNSRFSKTDFFVTETRKCSEIFSKITHAPSYSTNSQKRGEELLCHPLMRALHYSAFR